MMFFSLLLPHDSFHTVYFFSTSDEEKKYCWFAGSLGPENINFSSLCDLYGFLLATFK